MLPNQMFSRKFSTLFSKQESHFYKQISNIIIPTSNLLLIKSNNFKHFNINLSYTTLSGVKGLKLHPAKFVLQIIRISIKQNLKCSKFSPTSLLN